MAYQIHCPNAGLSTRKIQRTWFLSSSFFSGRLAINWVVKIVPLNGIFLALPHELFLFCQTFLTFSDCSGKVHSINYVNYVHRQLNDGFDGHPDVGSSIGLCGFAQPHPFGDQQIAKLHHGCPFEMAIYGRPSLVYVMP